MYSVVRFLFFFSSLFYAITGDSQLFPQDGRKLCFRIIGFSFPAETGATSYKIEIANGSYNTESEFEKNICTSVTGKKNKIIGEVPYWGRPYTWRTVCFANNRMLSKSGPHYFSTNITDDVDTAKTRLRIMQRAEKYKDAYVFIDNTRALYDMKGKAVWFLPGTELKSNANANPRDLKITPQGTITFMTGGLPYEITYDGDILWHYTGTASRDYKETFNHDFIRLHNNHYVCLVSTDIYTPKAAFKGSVARNASDTARFYTHTQYCTIQEFDKSGNIVWLWNGYDYIKNSDLYAHNPEGSAVDINDLHENSVYFDEQHKFFYLSFRNISRVIKIKYPEGNVAHTYGTLYKPGIHKMDNALFCYQHSCRVSQKGYLYLYDNNTCGTPAIPKIEIMQEPTAGRGDLKEIWWYRCSIEDPKIAAEKNLSFYQGGNVLELPDQSMFVSMGNPYSKIFIVGLDKKELWSAMPEIHDPASGKWKQPAGLYRASIITSRKELEKLIWNSER